MARCLIIGCGCRGLTLAAELRDAGHAVRGTTRDPSRAATLLAAGVEPHVGDPDRVATIAPAFDHVSVAIILLASAAGSPEQLEALHGTRLEMLLTRMLDTTIRAIVYETRGGLDDRLLAAGAARVRAACEASLIPYALLDADPSDLAAWTVAARESALGFLA